MVITTKGEGVTRVSKLIQLNEIPQPKRDILFKWNW